MFPGASLQKLSHLIGDSSTSTVSLSSTAISYGAMKDTPGLGRMSTD